MRRHARKGPLSVHAIAGTHVVILGIDAPRKAAKGLLGFALHRTDHTEDEGYWLRGFRTFKETDPDLPPGTLVSTYEHPIQSFLWGDYTAKPDHRYTYRVVAVYGRPKNLKHGPEVRVAVATQREDRGRHAVFFNRGAAGSQAYARKFGNRRPADVHGGGAWRWLSRGLEEAMLAFIGRAKGPRHGLRAAVYEFNHMPALKAFKTASEAGADVKIVYDARPGGGQPVAASDRAIGEAGIRHLMIPRRRNPSYIAHNKFIVLLRNGRAEEVWTGSTNLTAAGIFGQSNVGHVVRDRRIARAYLDYWERLAADPDAEDLRARNLAASPDPAGPPPKGITAVFSPRPDLAALEWYAQRMDLAARSVNFTAAFGVNAVLARVLGRDRDHLRYLLLEKPGVTYDEISRDPDTQIAVGSILTREEIRRNGLHRWLGERLTGLNRHVLYVHTKYLLIDPLGEDPVVISGSANFSQASTKNNDENMLIVRGDEDLADAYLGEFMRLFNHYYFRMHAARMARRPGTEEHEAGYLKPDDSWSRPYYEAGSVKQKQRLLFRAP